MAVFPIYYDVKRLSKKKYVSKLINFIGVEVDNILFEPERWSDTFNPNLVTVPRSAHDGDGILGYSTKRVDNWKKNLEDPRTSNPIRRTRRRDLEDPHTST